MAFSGNKKNHIHLKAGLPASSDEDQRLMPTAMTQLN